MASENDIGGKVGLDITDFKANIAELNRQIKVIDSGFKAAAAGMDDWSKSEEGLQERISALNAVTDLQRQKIANLTSQYEKVAAEKGENSKAAQDLQVRINKETEALNKNETELRKTQTALDNFGEETAQADQETKEFDQSVGGLGESLKTVGEVAAKAAIAGIAAVGAAAAAALVGIVKHANDSEKAFNQFQASTGATAEEMEEFRDVAQSIYTANLGESIDDVARSMAAVKQVTFQTGTELEATTKSALLMRDVFEFDVTESINTVNSLTAAFGITAEEAYTLIAQGAQMGANKNGDLLDVMNEYAPHFAQLGLDANEFTDTLIQGAVSGAFQIDKVGDAVKEFGIRAKDESKLSAEGFAAIGLNAEEMFATFAKGGPEAQEAFNQVIQKLGELEDPLAQNQAGVALFGTMFEDLGIEAIQQLADIDDNADMTRNTLQQMQQIKFNDLGSAFEGLKRQALDGLSPVTAAATDMISGIVNGIQSGDWDAVGQALTDGITNMVTQFASMMPDLAGIASSIIGGLASSVLAAVPEMLPAIIETALSLLNTLVQTITDNGPMLIDTAVSAITTLVRGISDALPQVIEAAISIIMALVDSLIDNLPEIINAAVDIVFALVDGILDLLPELIPAAIDLIVTLANGIIDALPRLIEKLPQIITTIINVITANLPRLIKAAIDIVLMLTRALIDNLPLLVKAGIEILGAVISGILSLLVELPGVALDIFRMLTKAFKEIDWATLGKNLINGITEGVKNAAKNLANSVADAAKNALDAAKKFLGIKSPSRVMRDQVGLMIGAGMADGIEDSAKQVQAAMRDLSSVSTDAIPLTSESANASAIGTNTVQQGPIINMDGLFAGAIINVRQESDIKAIAEELFMLQRNAMRGAGFA